MNLLRFLASLIALLVISIPICLSSEINFIYDANGNLLSDGEYTRTYNSLNQLIQVTDATNGNLVQEFIHDPVEELIIKKTEYHTNQSIKETIYYFDKDFIRIINASGIYNTAYINLQGHQIAEHTITTSTESTTTSFTHTDHLGSITQTVPHNAFNPYDSPGSLQFRDQYGSITAIFTPNGSIYTKGSITENTNPSRTDNEEFIINLNNQDVAILDLSTGSLSLKSELVSVSSITEDPNQDEFIFKDQNGNIALLINASGHLLYTGEIIDSAITDILYEPYGATIAQTNSRFAYEGKELSATGYDFHFRNYNPELGLFTQPDTLLPNVYDPQQLNRYAFERGDPSRYIDPNGHLAPLIALSFVLSAIAFSVSATIIAGDIAAGNEVSKIDAILLGASGAGLIVTSFGLATPFVAWTLFEILTNAYSGYRAYEDVTGDEPDKQDIEEDQDIYETHTYVIDSNTYSKNSNQDANMLYSQSNSQTLYQHKSQTPNPYIQNKIDQSKNNNNKVKWYYNPKTNTYTWRVDDSIPNDDYEEFDT